MKLAIVALALLTIGVRAQEHNVSYSAFDFPGAATTNPSGINDAGDVAGSYTDNEGRTHGFVRHGETFTSIDFPGASFTNARGVSASGEVVGMYRMPGEPNDHQHGYRFTRNGQFSKIDFPGHISTHPVRLLPNGTIVGCYHDTAGMDSMHGMVYARGAFSGFERAMTMHEGMTPDGRTLVGYHNTMTDMQHAHGYVLEDGKFTSFDVPGSVSTLALDVNGAGIIVGTFDAPAGTSHGFLREGSHYETFDAPGAKITRASGINALGTIVGSFVDAVGATHGYVATRK